VLSAASFGSNGSLLARASARLSCPEPASRSGFSLAHNDRFRTAIMRSLFPTCLFNALAEPSSSPFGLRLLADTVSHAVPAISTPPARLLISVQQSQSRLGSPRPLRGFCPFRISAFNPIWYRKTRLSEAARFSVAPRFRYAQCRLRLMTSGPLLPRRLTVPQTSWNQFNFPPDGRKKSIGF
jgi:hypothetical protein